MEAPTRSHPTLPWNAVPLHEERCTRPGDQWRFLPKPNPDLRRCREAIQILLRRARLQSDMT
eukprot:530799-Prorocentrum_lima.AAC.1